MTKSLFEKIVDREIPAWIVYEDATHIAFLTPFANTPGVTVVCPKNNPGDYIFAVYDSDYLDLLSVSKKIALAIEKALNVSRVALVIEGTGVPHIHVKLYPLHGELGNQTGLFPHHQEFYPEYIGYLTTVEGPKMDESKLKNLQDLITKELSS